MHPLKAVKAASAEVCGESPDHHEALSIVNGNLFLAHCFMLIVCVAGAPSSQSNKVHMSCEIGMISRGKCPVVQLV